MLESDPNDKTTDERRISLSMRQLGSGALYLMAALVFLAAGRINPWVAALFEGAQALDYANVHRSFFITAVVIGVVIVSFAYWISKGKSWADGAVLLVVMVAGLVLADRYLLTHFAPCRSTTSSFTTAIGPGHSVLSGKVGSRVSMRSIAGAITTPISRVRSRRASFEH